MYTKAGLQKERLEQKKARLLRQEANLRLRERRARTRHLISVGNIAAKADIDKLPADVLFGAMLYIKEHLKNDKSFLAAWKAKGASVFEKATKNKNPVILSFSEKPESNIRTIIRGHGLKWNALRKEWYGYVTDVEKLKNDLDELEFKLDVL